MGGFVGTRESNQTASRRTVSALLRLSGLALPPVGLRPLRLKSLKTVSPIGAEQFLQSGFSSRREKAHRQYAGIGKGFDNAWAENRLQKPIGFGSLVPKPGASVCAQKVCRGQTF